MNFEYRVGGSLDAKAPCYVRRKADSEFYQALKKGEFCYVLNCRQMGKSSLAVRTMQRLQTEEGFVCAFIDFTEMGNDPEITREQWYGGFLRALVSSLGLSEVIDWSSWWQEKQMLPPAQRLSELVREVLLKTFCEPIVIFIDEIDSVLGLEFCLDDFFALIRYFYNQRAIKPEYRRITFALLGVATPSALIQDKSRTPFNIGRGIELEGFQRQEVQPLIKGLQGKVKEPERVMEEVLWWTRGQPFLVQKICKLLVEESVCINSSSVEKVVKARILKNWESQDEPPHLRTIQDRILLKEEEKAGYLLELYQRIHERREINVDESLEQSELLLSGLVIRKYNQLKVYNPIYQEVFDQGWIEESLRSLRPYSEVFRAWLGSGKQDKSRLLRGSALEEAEQWASGKNLSYQDREFLSASRTKETEEEIIQKEKKAELERERKAREAAEEAERIQYEANKKAQRRIRIGSLILVLTFVITLISGTWAAIEANRARQAKQESDQAKSEKEIAEKEAKKYQQESQHWQSSLKELKLKSKDLEKHHQILQEQVKNYQNKSEIIARNLKSREKELEEVAQKFQLAQKEIETATYLSKRAAYFLDQKKQAKADEVFLFSSISFNLKTYELRQALRFASLSMAYQEVGELERAKAQLEQTFKLVEPQKNRKPYSNEELQVIIYSFYAQGNLLKQMGDSRAALIAYANGFNLLAKNPKLTTSTINLKTKIIRRKEVEHIHRSLLFLLEENKKNNSKLINLTNKVEASLKQYYLSQKEFYKTTLLGLLNNKKWKEADHTTRLILAYSALIGDWKSFDISKISCSEIANVERLWLNSSKRRFGFTVQNKIYSLLIGDVGKFPNTIEPHSLNNYNGSHTELVNGTSGEASGINFILGWMNYESKEDNSLGKRVSKRYGDLTWKKNAPEISSPGHLPVIDLFTVLNSLEVPSDYYRGLDNHDMNIVAQRIDSPYKGKVDYYGGSLEIGNHDKKKNLSWKSKLELCFDTNDLSIPYPSPLSQLKSPETGINYRILATILALNSRLKHDTYSSKNYNPMFLKEANESSILLLLYGTDFKTNKHVNSITNEISKIACVDLQIVNNLWTTFSNGHLGFSVQRDILKNANQSLTEDKKAYQILAREVGWKQEPDNNKDLQYNDNEAYTKLEYSLSKIPRGHLPSVHIGAKPELWEEWGSALMRRVEDCDIKPGLTVLDSNQLFPAAISTPQINLPKNTNIVHPLSTSSEVFSTDSNSSIVYVQSTSPETDQNYSFLANLLALEEWERADLLTWRLMTDAWNPETEKSPDGMLESEIATFPCSDLQIINHLWGQYSSGHFGFSVQREIFESVGGGLNSDKKAYRRLALRVGWKSGNDLTGNGYYSPDKFIFNMEAPRGHLPTFGNWESAEKWESWDLAHAKRLVECDIRELNMDY